MRIAQVAPLAEAVPPSLYGGTERVVSWLTEELVARGHDVTLFASGDSRTSARLREGSPRALRLAGVRDQTPYLSRLMRMVLDESLAGRFDVVHFHVDHFAFPIASVLDRPAVIHTMHGRLDDPHLLSCYRAFEDLSLVSISDSQRTPFPGARWVATIHHGMPLDAFRVVHQPRRPGYALFLGRVSPEKGPHLAIEAALAAGVPLKMAAKVDAKDREFWASEVRPRIEAAGEAVEWLGEVDDAGKQRLLGEATALLFPIDWPEPFGLVAIEALACGTPVVARPCGAVTEIVEPGVTGFLASDRDGLAEGLLRAPSLDRAACRRQFEHRFSVQRMVDDYERVYEVAGARPRARGIAA
jgi:glycosyltransferase involved in cell wall biosynthesis